MKSQANLLLSASAIVYFVAAGAALFLPQELLNLGGAEVNPLNETLLQVLASALLGFAMLNWMNRYSRVGGIFGRPLVMANFAHTFSAGATLVKLVVPSAFAWPVVVVAGLYVSLALAFGIKLFSPTPVD